MRKPAETPNQLQLRLESRYRAAAGLPSLPIGTLMDPSGFFPVMPMTRTSSHAPRIGNMKRAAPTKEADTRPTSPKRPKI